MSRAPAVETPAIPMTAALSPFGVIDFADNHLASHTNLSTLTSLTNLSATAGPPAYLEAHGIRYVPSMAAEANIATDYTSPENYVSMSKDASKDPVVVSQRELNSRVDDRIKRFLSSDSRRGEGSLRSIRDDMEDYDVHSGTQSMRSAASLDAEWKELRMECDAASRRSQAMKSRILEANPRHTVW